MVETTTSERPHAVVRPVPDAAMEMRVGAAPVLAVLGAAALSACGGGDDALPAAFEHREQAQSMRHILAAGADTVSTDAPTPVPSTTELLDWAELAYTELFPGRKPDLQADPYTYRHYPETGHYLGVASGRVYFLGPASGNVLADVGAVSDFGPRIYGRRFAFSDAQASRFLAQATLGVTDTDIAAVRAAGYEAWLTQQFARPISTSNWDWLVARGIDLDLDNRNSTAGADAAIWQRLLGAPDSLRQRVALALSEIFVVGLDGLNGAWRQFKIAAWWDLLATHAFGNFRTLLEAITLNPAMGGYLNTAGNKKEDPATGRQPDENYAREVMQLFTIGLVQLDRDGTPKRDAAGRTIDTYNQDTVTNLARVFTGWNLDSRRGDTGPELTRRPMVLTASLHSTLAASFLGATVPANTEGTAALKIALDTLAAHPNVGPFIGRQLIQKLVTSNPSRHYVARVAAAFDDNGQGQRGDLQAVLKAVLLDVEARDDFLLSSPQIGKLREPMLRFIQCARSFKASSITAAWDVGNTSDPARSLGQSPLRSPSVFNFFRPGYVPAGTAIAAAGLVAPEFQLANESSVAGYLNAMQTFVGRTHRDVRPDYTTELALATDAEALVSRVALLMCAGQLADTTRSTIVGAVNSIAATTDAGKANRVYTAVLLVMASPDYLVQK